jgi:hypothetical protein
MRSLHELVIPRPIAVKRLDHMDRMDSLILREVRAVRASVEQKEK